MITWKVLILVLGILNLQLFSLTWALPVEDETTVAVTATDIATEAQATIFPTEKIKDFNNLDSDLDSGNFLNSTKTTTEKLKVVGANFGVHAVPFGQSRRYQIDDLEDDLATWKAPYDIPKKFPFYLTGYDSEGRGIWVFEYGKMDLRSIVEKGAEHQEALRKYLRQTVYIIRKDMKNRSTPDNQIDEASYLMDFDELPLRQVAYLPNLNFLFHLAQDHRDLYLNHLGPVIIVNTNFLAEQVVNLVKPVFGPAAEKIEVYGTNKQKWLPVVRQVFGSQNLAEWYGGVKKWKPLAVYG